MSNWLGRMANCSLSAPSFQAAAAVLPVFIICAMLFSGFFIGSDSIPAYIAWGQYLSYIKYAFAGVSINQFKVGTACY